MYDYHKQVQTDIIMHSKEKVLEMLEEVGLEGRLDEGESGFQTRKVWKGVPDKWAIGRERAGVEGGEFRVREVQAVRV